MPSRKPSPPAYRHFKARNLAVVRIDGKDHYLGRFNSPESREKYHVLIAAWHARRINGVAAIQSVEPSSDGPFFINPLVEAYLGFARQYYQKDVSVR